MTNYYFDTELRDGMDGLCKRMTGKALQSPYRSTVPLLSLIEHCQPQWQSLLDLWALPKNSAVHFEYCVASPKPGGNPSKTDALLISDSTVCAIEAKWTESRYATVANRISKPESDGADPRHTVDGWLNYIQPFATKDLRVDGFLNVVYQVLHRAASACAVATDHQCLPELVYLHFHPSPLPSTATTDQYISDLRHLRELLGDPAEFGLSVVEMRLEATASFKSIKNLDKRSPETAVQVKAALCNGPLFTFGRPIITRI